MHFLVNEILNCVSLSCAFPDRLLPLPNIPLKVFAQRSTPHSLVVVAFYFLLD